MDVGAVRSRRRRGAMSAADDRAMARSSHVIFCICNYYQLKKLANSKTRSLLGFSVLRCRDGGTARGQNASSTGVMPKMRAGTFFKNPFGAISNAFSLNKLKDRIKALEEDKKRLERELRFASSFEDVDERLKAMDHAARGCYDALTSVLGKLNELPRFDEGSSDVGDEDEMFCVLLEDVCRRREEEDEDDRESRIRALLESYRDRVSRRADARHTRGASPFSHRLYRFVDRQLSELSAFRDDLRKETRMQFENTDELKRVNQRIREAEEKLSAVRQKQFG